MTPPVNSKSQMIQQALDAESKAQQAYNEAGYQENALAAKAKDGDVNAESALPEANERKLVAQNELKNAQSKLARLTGADDPHRKKSYPRLAEATPKHKTAGEHLIASKKPTKVAAFVKVIREAKSKDQLLGLIDTIMAEPKKAQELMRTLDAGKIQGEHMLNMEGEHMQIRGEFMSIQQTPKFRVPNQDK